ncbi:MAG: AI-2E family transporter [Bacteroidota bacterium]|nr:AI-2E family transporter [Bacteroidota bacterium]
MMVSNQSPFYVKLGFKFLVIFFICFFVYAAQNILIPFAFAILLSVVLLPIVQLLERKNFSKVLSIAIAIIFALSVIAGVIYFLSSQITSFIRDIPSIKEHVQDHFIALQNWIKEKFNISFHEQNSYLNEQAEKLKESGTGYISHTFLSITEAVMLLILMPIYTFLLLYYRDLLKRFLLAVFKPEHSKSVKNVLAESQIMVRSYMLGLLIEMGIVAAANSIGLLILGIPYAIFFGILAAVLNLIPYIGMFTATLLTVLTTLSTTSNTSDLLWIIIIFYSIHIVDVNFLMPRIVASRVRINALISILGVVIGGALTGISGLFLSIPAIAFLKILCDEVDELKPWGILLGDDISYTKKSRLYKGIKKISAHRFKRLMKKN